MAALLCGSSVRARVLRKGTIKSEKKEKKVPLGCAIVLACSYDLLLSPSISVFSFHSLSLSFSYSHSLSCVFSIPTLFYLRSFFFSFSVHHLLISFSANCRLPLSLSVFGTHLLTLGKWSLSSTRKKWRENIAGKKNGRKEEIGPQCDFSGNPNIWITFLFLVGLE